MFNWRETLVHPAERMAARTGRNPVVVTPVNLLAASAKAQLRRYNWAISCGRFDGRKFTVGGFLNAIGGLFPMPCAGFRRPNWKVPMTDPAKTLIAALLDRSGSMSQSKEATEDGWRELIEEQRGNPGHCQVTLAQFDTGYEVLYPPTDIEAVPEFTVEPGGMTALLDAAGRFITEVGQQLSALPEHERPGQVVCLIMTDGMENASQHWNWDDVQRLVTQQREVYGWEWTPGSR